MSYQVSAVVTTTYSAHKKISYDKSKMQVGLKNDCWLKMEARPEQQKIEKEKTLFKHK